MGRTLFPPECIYAVCIWVFELAVFLVFLSSKFLMITSSRFCHGDYQSSDFVLYINLRVFLVFLLLSIWTLEKADNLCSFPRFSYLLTTPGTSYGFLLLSCYPFKYNPGSKIESNFRSWQIMKCGEWDPTHAGECGADLTLSAKDNKCAWSVVNDNERIRVVY